MKHFESLLKFIPDLRERKILDLGFGKGNILKDFIKNGCIDVSGIDSCMDRVTELYRDGFGVWQGHGEEMPYEEDSFDFINCNMVTEHCEDPYKLVSECYRVLRTGGKMYITFCNRLGWYDGHYKMRGINWLPRKWADPVYHLLGKKRPVDDEKGHHSFFGMHYFYYKEKLKILKDFRIVDTRKERLGYSWLLLREFFSESHFIVEKR